MKRIFLFLMLMMTFSGINLQAQTYEQLWKEQQEAEEKDLPQSQIEVLQRIAKKSIREKAYGQLLAASLKEASLKVIISPDSLQPAIDWLLEKSKAAEANDKALAAVYNTVLGNIFTNNEALGDNHVQQGKAFYQKALSFPEILARTKDAGFTPLVNQGKDAGIFSNDLLNVIGREVGDWQTLATYYNRNGNRAAACYAQLQVIVNSTSNKQAKLEQLDSLFEVVGNLPVCGEVAIERYNLMTDATPQEQYDYCEKAVRRWEKWPRINVLRNEMKTLTTPTVSFNVGREIITPRTEQTVQIKSRNVGEVELSLVRLKVKGNTNYSPDDKDDLQILKRFAVAGTEQTFARHYAGHATYEMVEDSLVLPELPVGVYLLKVKTDNERVKPIMSLYYVTGVCPLLENQPDGTTRIAVVDYKTGQPIAGAKIEIKTSRQWGRNATTTTLTTDAKGEATLQKQSGSYDVYAYTSADEASPSLHAWNRFYYHKDDYPYTKEQIFTDRAIYRPGQTVHVSVLRYEVTDGEHTRALKNQAITMHLKDANYQEVGSQQVTTDEFGVASADFTLPKDGLSGRFTIRTDESSTAIQVEEYKRPTFEVTFDEVKESYKVGDTLTVHGTAKTYAGIPVQGGKVSWSVERRQALWWWWRERAESEDYEQEGTATTDDEGRFTIQFPLTLPKQSDDLGAAFYNFDATATVTDQAGESHDGSILIPVGTKPTAFSCNLPAKLLVDSIPNVVFAYKNMAGQAIEGKVKIRIDDQNETTVNANESVALSSLLFTRSSGSHTLFATCGEDTLTQSFVLFSMSDKTPVVETHDWFYQSSGEFPRDGKPVFIQIGASDPDLHILYSIFSGDRVVEQGAIDQSAALTTLKYTYKEAYGDGLLFTFAWVKDGVFYKYEATVSRPQPDRKLKVEWTTFRDRLTPGQDEEWTLRITRPDGSPAKAQLMATLYDNSLDQIAAHDWAFSSDVYTTLPRASWSGRVVSISRYFKDSSAPFKRINEPHITFSSLNDDYYRNLLYCYGYQYARLEGMVCGATPMRRMENVVSCKEASYDMAAPVVAMEMKADDNAMEAERIVTSQGIPSKSEHHEQVQLRENLNETAFFYPQLQTDHEGAVSLKFKLPESVTTWRFLGLAHDQEMNYGLLEAEAVAKKTIMVIPNVPRFVREGDKATLAARIFNTSENAVSGMARIELFSAASLAGGAEQSCWSDEVAFDLDESATGAVTFRLPEDLFADLYVVRVSASGEGFSDGEQHYMPILTSKEYITTTLPLTFLHAADTIIDAGRLFPQGTSERRLSVEYTQHPEWLAIEALPYMSVPDGDNAISLTTAFFANMLGSSVLTNNQHIKQVVSLWQQEQGSESALTSTLEKDADLKMLVLKETPWVMEANRETEQRNNLVRFFDENTLQNNMAAIEKKLKSLQNPDGSFSWWQGMDGSSWITMSVVKTLTRLEAMLSAEGKSKQLQSYDFSTLTRSAFSYLEKEVAERVADMKKWEKKGAKDLFPSDFLCDYAYASALAGRRPSADILYIIDKMERQKSVLSIYGKANTAVILHLYGRDNRAKDHLESMKQYTVYKEDMGRYFDTPKANYSWCNYRMPSQVAAIEALQALTPGDKQTIAEMQRWLLQEKRTTMWDTPVNCVEAVWSLFSHRSSANRVVDGSPTVSTAISICLPGHVLATKDASPVSTTKLSIPVSEAKDLKVKWVSVPSSEQSAQTETLSFGAIYAQYLQDMQEVEASQSGFAIVRELLGGDKPLKVGDKVKVRITIRADRDYDFVQIVDKRAACLEPVEQTSGYRYGCYTAPKDQQTCYYFDQLAKGTHIIETEYYVDREGDYQSGTCVVQCAYSPEFMGKTGGQKLSVGK